MNLNDYAKDIHNNAVEHGWWEEDRKLPEVVALCHSELSEALEEYRNDKGFIYYNDTKPEGIAIEMIDCMIRILDYLAYLRLDIDRFMLEKMAYNTMRPYKHGGKRC